MESIFSYCAVLCTHSIHRSVFPLCPLGWQYITSPQLHLIPEFLTIFKISKKIIFFSACLEWLEFNNPFWNYHKWLPVALYCFRKIIGRKPDIYRFQISVGFIHWRIGEGEGFSKNAFKQPEQGNPSWFFILVEHVSCSTIPRTTWRYPHPASHPTQPKPHPSKG